LILSSVDVCADVFIAQATVGSNGEMSDTLPEDGVARAEIDEMAASTVEAKTLRE